MAATLHSTMLQADAEAQEEALQAAVMQLEEKREARETLAGEISALGEVSRERKARGDSRRKTGKINLLRRSSRCV